MLTTASQIIVIALGAFVCAFSLWGELAPQKVIKLVVDVMEKSWAVPVGVISRVLLGGALIVASPASRFPTFFYFLGWFAIAAAVGILLLGPKRMREIAAWFARLSATVIRVWLVFGLLFGAVLIYGIIQPTAS